MVTILLCVIEKITSQNFSITISPSEKQYSSSSIQHQILSSYNSKKELELNGMQAVGSINSFHIHNWIHGIYCILPVEP